LKQPVTGGSSNNNFLTAAEQRAQSNKNEKKSQEDSFSFLVDPLDVSIQQLHAIRPLKP